MAYKFQFGQAILSGALDQEGAVQVLDNSGNTKIKLDTDGDISGSGNFELKGLFKMGGVHTAGNIMVADGTSMVKVAMSGDATLASNGALTIANDAVEQAMIADDAVGADQLADNAVTQAKIADDAVGADELASNAVVNASVASGAAIAFSKMENVSSARLIVGNGSNVPTAVDVTGDVTISNTGVTTIGAGTVHGSMLSVDVVSDIGGIDLSSNELFLTGAAIMDHIAVNVGTDNMLYMDATGSVRQDSIVDFSSALAGTSATTALKAASGVLSLDIANLTAEVIASGDKIVFNDAGDNGLHSETVDDLFTKGLPLLTEAAFTVADDYVVFLDGSGTGDGKKEKWSDLVTLMAGAGLTAVDGTLTTDAGSVEGLHDGMTLDEGYNFASGSAGATVSLPGSPTVGDQVVVKMSSAGDILINTSGSHTIDGADNIRLESPYSAVTLVYLAANNWGIV